MRAAKENAKKNICVIQKLPNAVVASENNGNSRCLGALVSSPELSPGGHGAVHIVCTVKEPWGMQSQDEACRVTLTVVPHCIPAKHVC